MNTIDWITSLMAVFRMCLTNSLMKQIHRANCFQSFSFQWTTTKREIQLFNLKTWMKISINKDRENHLSGKLLYRVQYILKLVRQLWKAIEIIWIQFIFLQWSPCLIQFLKVQAIGLVVDGFAQPEMLQELRWR